MRSKPFFFFLIGLTFAARPVFGQSAAVVDSAIARSHQQWANSDSVASRATLESILKLKAVNPMQRAEAMHWLARYAPTAADRERTLGVLIIDYPFSPRVPKALYEIATLELGRSDRDRAAVHLARFLSSSPEDSNRVSASLTLGRLLLERGDQSRGCAVLLSGRTEVPADAVEIRNQFEFSAARCRGVDTTTVSPLAAPADTTPTRRRTGAFTIQVAAFDLRGTADRLVTTLRAQGLEARVVGKANPFRVRVGRYSTRAEAESASRRVDAIAKSRSIVVVAGPEDR